MQGKPEVLSSNVAQTVVYRALSPKHSLSHKADALRLLQDEASSARPQQSK